MVISHTNDEINNEVRSANNSAEPSSQIQVRTEKSLLHHVQKEHLSIGLLEFIQTILFMII